MRSFLRLLGLLVAAVVLGCAVVLWAVYVPYQGFNGEEFVDLNRGAGTAKIANQLKDEGVIRYAWAFKLARALKPGVRLQAGQYKFDHPASVMEVYSRIARGDVFYYEVRIPEGKNIFEIAEIAHGAGLFSAANFVTAAKDPTLIRDLDPQAPSLEGYLFPNTYRITRGTTARKLCEMMTGRFREEWRKLGNPANVHDVVTLASLVEKESKLQDERPLVAQVFAKRLTIGMKLDCDPTTIYAALLEGRYRGTIYKSDLESASPYNTYRHAGLPPGPIANPGVPSLKAALKPADTNYVYFVRKPDDTGAHAFAATIEEHAANTRKYRQAQ